MAEYLRTPKEMAAYLEVRIDGNVIVHWEWPSFAPSNRARLQKEDIETTSEKTAETVPIIGGRFNYSF